MTLRSPLVQKARRDVFLTLLDSMDRYTRRTERLSWWHRQRDADMSGGGIGGLQLYQSSF